MRVHLDRGRQLSTSATNTRGKSPLKEERFVWFTILGVIQVALDLWQHGVLWWEHAVYLKASGKQQERKSRG